ncbi:MAG: glycerol kinase GlpK [Bryobacteraceae bacterium]|nr:glycerol kinase GlpK [Bryobacteraceae bacterium]
MAAQPSLLSRTRPSGSFSAEKPAFCILPIRSSKVNCCGCSRRKNISQFYNAEVPYILALDEGTTSARAALYDREARRIAIESAPIPCRYPQSGWVEQDAEDIWVSQVESARRVLETASVSPSALVALGITNQRETTIVWDRTTGRPVAPAIVWQCRRTAAECDEIQHSGRAATISAKTGLVIDAYFSATKLQWILRAVPDAYAKARDGEILFGTVDTWLIWRLTNGAVHATDTSNASRTMLMNLESGDWDRELLDYFGVPHAMLPRIVPSSGVVGVAAAEHFGAEVPIGGIAGDQQAALFGQACFRPGLCKNTYGTGCFALMHTGARRPVSGNQLVATRAAGSGDSPVYAIEGSIFIAGAAVQWLRDKLGLIRTASESETVAASVPDTDGVYLVPAFVGLGAPHWDASARGIVCGITQATSAQHIVRAALESIAYQTRELVEAMEADSGESLSELRVDGGAAANNFLMQFQADILGRRLVRPVDTETTALGASFLAGLAAGFWKDCGELEQFWQPQRTFEPRMQVERREELYDGWKTAVRRCRLADHSQG